MYKRKGETQKLKTLKINYYKNTMRPQIKKIIENIPFQTVESGNDHGYKEITFLVELEGYDTAAEFTLKVYISSDGYTLEICDYPKIEWIEINRIEIDEEDLTAQEYDTIIKTVLNHLDPIGFDKIIEL